MAIKAQAKIEPIPGYKLIERLGGGGFGEVWKAEAPGGLHKAIKFVHGTLKGEDSDNVGVHQELKSLNRVKSVRHPFILSLERYDIIDGQLLIVMELADRNLWDRFKECQSQKLPGIPRDELLRYMEEAAEALDLMNIQYGLQHLDIKPQNLFLVHNHVKVADFGLVKDLEGRSTQVTGGITTAYAAPETYEGTVSRFCDQYSLAIVYQELLTGLRPFRGTNARQLMMQHVAGPPALQVLPECDQPIIGRALAKKPDDRFPSCVELVHALRQAGLTASVLGKDLRPSLPVPPPATVWTPPLPLDAAALVAETKAAAPGPTRAPLLPEPVICAAVAAPLPSPPPAVPATPRSPAPTPPPKKVPVAVEQKPEATGDGSLFPALIIGVGGLGRRVLQRLRQELHQRSGPPESLPHIQLLYIESDPEAVPKALGGPADLALTENEVVLARLNKPSHYLRPGHSRGAIEAWLNMNMICRLPRNQVTTDGLRVMGRLAFFDNYRTIAAKVKADLTTCTAGNAISAADKKTHLGLRSSWPRVYVLASLGGGTGSGMFIDVAYAARRQLQDLGYAKSQIVGLFLLPAADRSTRKHPSVVNAFAALTELNHFSTPGVTYSSTFAEAHDAFFEKVPPFDRSILLPLPAEGSDAGGTNDLLLRAADFLCRDLVSPLGRAADEARAQLEAEPGVGMTCQTFGSYSYSQPRRLLVRRVGKVLAQRLLRGWLTADRALAKAVRNRLVEECTAHELHPEGLIGQLQAACETNLEQPPEAIFEAIVDKYFGPDAEQEPATALDARGELAAVVGMPGAGEPSSATSTLEEFLKEAEKQQLKRCEEKLLGMVRDIIDDPRFRVAGALEACARILAVLDDGIEQHQSLLEELGGRSNDAFGAIESLVGNLMKGCWWPGRKAKLADELREMLQVYPKARYQGMVLASLVRIYKTLVEKLPKRFEEIAFCRQRVTMLVNALEEATSSPGAIVLTPGRQFLPGDCNSVEEAMEALLDALQPDDVYGVDLALQEVIKSQLKSLPAVFLGSNELFREFRAALLQQAEAKVEEMLGNASVAKAYLQQTDNEQQVAEELATAFESAAPELPGPRSSSPETMLLVVPSDSAGAQLGQLARSLASEVEVVLADSPDDILFYRERPYVPLADLPQLSLLAEESYKQAVSTGHFTPHARTDISEWRPAT